MFELLRTRCFVTVLEVLKGRDVELIFLGPVDQLEYSLIVYFLFTFTMKSTIVTSLGLFALQALAAPAEKRQQAKKASLSEILLGERIDALIDRTGGKKDNISKILQIRG